VAVETGRLLNHPFRPATRAVPHLHYTKVAWSSDKNRLPRRAWDDSGMRAPVHRTSRALGESAFLRACRGEAPAHIPVWFMRQAGRSLPEYLRVRSGVGMLESCLRSDLVVEITMQPVRRYRVDAAILFSDIVLPLKAAGVDLDIKPGVGPVIAQPIRTPADVNALPALDPAGVEAVAEAVRALTGELGSTPLIGFAGAPFTLASYLVEGGPSREHARTKALMYGDEASWHALADRLAQIALTFLRVQVEAGADAIQLFDSWAGTLSAADYERYVLPHSRTVLEGVREFATVPRIHFGVGTGELLGLLASAGADVVGVDWRVPLDDAARRVPATTALQGNLDPAVLFAPWPVVAERARDVIHRGRSAHGHVFNLGHGVLPDTDPNVLARLVDLVHSEPVS
jgi:uroporphyrinogen decarboxylase